MAGNPDTPTAPPPHTDATDTNPSSRPTADRHTTNARDRVARQGEDVPKSSGAISAAQRLHITLPGTHRYPLESLDALLAQWPDAELSWLDEHPTPASVFVAEVIWFGENPVDGRDRIAVCRSLDDAVTALREDDDCDRPDLVATEVTDSALGTEGARTWAVHERGTEPDDEGHLWITEEQIRPAGGTGE